MMRYLAIAALLAACGGSVDHDAMPEAGAGDAAATPDGAGDAIGAAEVSSPGVAFDATESSSGVDAEMMIEARPPPGDARPDCPVFDIDFCDPLHCLPNSIQCNGNQPQLCTASGAWVNFGPPCSIGCIAGVCALDCTPGTTQCSDGHVQVCEPTNEWRDELDAGCDGR